MNSRSGFPHKRRGLLFLDRLVFEYFAVTSVTGLGWAHLLCFVSSHIESAPFMQLSPPSALTPAPGTSISTLLPAYRYIILFFFLSWFAVLY